MEIINTDEPRCCLRNVKAGKNIKFFNFVNAYDCEIGDDSKIGAFVEIQKGAVIGKNCKISSHSFICEGVHIGDNVFIGHNVSFINDLYPRATNAGGKLQTENDWKLMETFVGNGASIGTSSTILAGLKIGENAMIGAGSLVAKDVPANAVVAGNPARLVRYLK